MSTEESFEGRIFVIDFIESLRKSEEDGVCLFIVFFLFFLGKG